MMNREENEIKDQRIERRNREKKQRNEARKGERERVAEKLEATRMVKLQ
jgi:hypothetical protein